MYLFQFQRTQNDEELLRRFAISIAEMLGKKPRGWRRCISVRHGPEGVVIEHVERLSPRLQRQVILAGELLALEIGIVASAEVKQTLGRGRYRVNSQWAEAVALIQ